LRGFHVAYLYRRYAVECLKLRVVAKDERARELLLAMASIWTELAEKNSRPGDRQLQRPPQEDPRR
jgi:hypothetical protein